MVEKLDDRAALPFLEEKSLMTNASRFIRARAAEIYASLATGEECAEFLPKILAIEMRKKARAVGGTALHLCVWLKLTPVLPSMNCLTKAWRVLWPLC